MKKKWYEWMLVVVYVAMVALCLFLNFTPGHRESIASIIVNVAMFVIIGAVFFRVNQAAFRPMNSMIGDLIAATDKIKKDAMNTHAYLWKPYQTNKVELFRDGKLIELYRDFIFELNREIDPRNAYYRPNIDDYINDELVDKTMHRNELNQVAGLLTGLGILGTFIGLSLGLQHFNTGTTAEMTNSIEPLMNGIKVAFHTSIYGMVFSLVFNAVYKKKLYEAEDAVDEFVSSFRKYVLPDTANDGMNQLIVFQEKQFEAINNVSTKISEDMAGIITPHLDRLHASIVDFENVATKSQTEAIGKIVDVFMAQMNQSLGSTFTELSQSVSEQYQAQKKNEFMMQDVLKATGSNVDNLNGINEATSKLIDTLNNYTESIQTITNEMKYTFSTLNFSNENNKNLLMQEQSMLKEQEKVICGFQSAIDDMVKSSQNINEEITDALLRVAESMDLMRKSLDKVSKADKPYKNDKPSILGKK